MNDEARIWAVRERRMVYEVDGMATRERPTKGPYFVYFPDGAMEYVGDGSNGRGA